MTQINDAPAKLSYWQSPQFKLWFAAIKPPMYTVAIIPIMVGTAVAFMETGKINLSIFGVFLSAAILIIAWLNISNDVFDADTGIDRHKAESIVNLTGNKNLMFWLANLFLIMGLGGIVSISYYQQDWSILGLVFLACFLGYTYQGPPFRLGYQGLGEIICFICFGPIALMAAYYSQCQSYSVRNLAVSVIIGISTSIILFCSHFHQVKDDAMAGKVSPIVMMGTLNGSKVLTVATISIYLLTVLLVVLGMIPVTSLLVGLSLPIAVKLIRFVRENHGIPSIIRTSKYVAVKLHFISGLLLAIGLIIPRLI